MLKKQIVILLSDLTDQSKVGIKLFKEEKNYVEKHELIENSKLIIEKDSGLRFSEAYIERVSKETEEFIAEEGPTFLNEPIHYLKKNMGEFIYLESNWFEMIGVDAVSLEVDDVFRTYDVMLGLKLQKKFQSTITSYLLQEFEQDDSNFDLMFSQEDGLWNLNFDLNSLSGFNEEMTIGEAYQLIFEFLFRLIETVEDSK